MSQFSENQWYETLHCCNCHTPFAISLELYRKRKDDHKSFWCPNGHEQHFTGKSEADKLREQLTRVQSEVGDLEARNNVLKHERNAISKAHQKMRKRIVNGVCPCCNRSFANLREHMKTQHADYGAANTLLALRKAFGMTQYDVAKEAGVPQGSVSAYERGKPVSVDTKESLDWWAERQGGQRA